MKLPLNFQIFSPSGLKISFREKGFLVKHRLVSAAAREGRSTSFYKEASPPVPLSRREGDR